VWNSVFVLSHLLPLFRGSLVDRVRTFLDTVWRSVKNNLEERAKKGKQKKQKLEEKKAKYKATDSANNASGKVLPSKKQKLPPDTSMVLETRRSTRRTAVTSYAEMLGMGKRKPPTSTTSTRQTATGELHETGPSISD